VYLQDMPYPLHLVLCDCSECLSHPGYCAVCLQEMQYPAPLERLNLHPVQQAAAQEDEEMWLKVCYCAATFVKK
jgi:hypothetical protein